MTYIVLLNFFTFYLFTALGFITSAPILSCRDAPYPQTCTSLISTNYQLLSDSTSTNFCNSHLQATIDKLSSIRQLASSMSMTTFDDQTVDAWNDCLFLLNDAINHLNKSVYVSFYHDSQTWISAALANYETCKNGFGELGFNYTVEASPFMSNIVFESLSNSLAINKANNMEGTYTYLENYNNHNKRRLLSDDQFPAWVSRHDRKLLQSSNVKANIVVAKDGSGDYKSISEAVLASSRFRKDGASRFIIHVKAGIYNENVRITKSMKNLMIVGDGMDKTVVTGSKSVQGGTTTFNSATFGVMGEGFIAQDITFENSAGPQKHQAVALRSNSDQSIFYRCSFKGYQDTLYVHSLRQFYRSCNIYGTVDFIFGDAVAVFQSCNIYLRKPMPGQQNTVTAQGRADPNENTGISVIDSNVAAAEGLGSGTKSYLGRPWQTYSRTVFMKTRIGGVIDRKGWLEWSGEFGLRTLYYGEYENSGDGAGVGGRVRWEGYHVMSRNDAVRFSVGEFLGGGSWISKAGVPCTLGI